MIKKFEKSLCFKHCRKKGRNNRGVITSRHRGGGHKRLYRKIDFTRLKIGIPARVKRIDYDPNRNAQIALLHYKDGIKKYILHPSGLQIGDWVISSIEAPIKIGNSLPVGEIPLGTQIHNVELTPGKGGQLVRAAGSAAQIIAKQKKFITLQLPSNEIRLISKNCWATVGQIGNVNFANTLFKKAGRKRWLDRRPSVRGVAMNAVDHPHGTSRSSKKGHPTIAPKNAPPGRKVGKIRPRRTGKKR